MVAGLGNPGKKYEGTRHNAGFMQADYLCEKLGVGPLRSKFSALCGEASIGGVRTLILKPQTYMNESGLAVADAADYYHIPPEKIIVVFDDISLPPALCASAETAATGGTMASKASSTA